MKTINQISVFILGFFSLFIMSVNTFAQASSDTVSWATLRARPYPQWFSDAKLGIFIHWGVYSVPSYGGRESYAEWYLRGLQVNQPERTDFMKRNYGEQFTYRDFALLFKAELFDADEWASIFKKAGAQYIILVSKHHDGYCLWPSQYATKWNSVEVGPHRDILDEIKRAVTKKGIRFGIYYSLPEWNNPLHYWYSDPNDSIAGYVEQHMIPQFKEVISKYKPEVLFTDGEWFNSAEDWHAKELIDWYYKQVGSEAIVNDRWGSGSDIGFKTPEYSSGIFMSDRPWAEVRGLGRSFGLNRNEKLKAYLTSKELIQLFAKTVAYGGGLVINVGPAADGKIPLLQQERIEELGKWIEINKEAIYGSKPWIRQCEEKEVSLTRIDSCINFQWVRNSPGFPVAEDHFTASWNGYITPPQSGEYHFSVAVDDGMKLFIDDKLIIDKWGISVAGTDSEAMREQLSSSQSSKIFLKKDHFYPVKIEYREDTHNADITLYWETGNFPEEVVKPQFLFTSNNPDAPNGLNAEYRSMREQIVYTQNNGHLFIICFEWPDDKLEIEIAKPEKGTAISLLGLDKELNWSYRKGKLSIETNNISFNEMPDHKAWVFKIANYCTEK